MAKVTYVNFGQPKAPTAPKLTRANLLDAAIKAANKRPGLGPPLKVPQASQKPPEPR
jgi:hypothetical protein